MAVAFAASGALLTAPIYSSFIESGWLQQGAVESGLPYLRKEISLPLDIGDDEDVALMISEDTLIALEKVSHPRCLALFTSSRF